MVTDADLDEALRSGALPVRQMLNALNKYDAENSLYNFISLMWPIVEPETQFIGSWVIEAICEHLEAVTEGQITRLCVNVFPGATKPVWEHEVISTRTGLRPLKDIRVGDEVLTHLGRFRRVTAVHEQGTLPLVCIKTQMGRELRAAADHPYLTTRGWVQAGDLLPSDVLAETAALELFGEETITLETARFLGYLIGDGCVKYGNATFTNMDPDVLEDFAHCAEQLGFVIKARSKPGNRAMTLNISSNRDGSAQRFMEYHGLRGTDSYTKTIPDAVMRGTPEIIRNFLGAYWSCDGYLNIRTDGNKTSYLGKLSTVSWELAHSTQALLSLLGIQTRLRRHTVSLESKRQPGGRYTSYDLRVYGESNVRKVADLPGLCARKRLAVSTATAREFPNHLSPDPVVFISPDDEGECRCLTVEEDASFVAGGVAVHNSLITSVFWPAWEWGPRNKAALRYLCFSYASHLTERDNRRFRAVVASPLYRLLWGDRFKLVNDATGWIMNNRTGWKLASSVGGVGTGERGDRIIIDDGNKPPTDIDVGDSAAVMKTTGTWFREVLPDRLNSLQKSAIVNIQQRISDLDISGIIKELDLPYTFVHIPMLLDTLPDASGRRFPIIPSYIGWVDPRYREDWHRVEQDPDYRPSGEIVDDEELDRRDGIPADPRRFPLEQLEELRTVKGPYAWASQYQQTVVPRGGGIIREEWWQPWEEPEFPPYGTCVAFLDTAYKEGQHNDYNALTVWTAFAHPVTEKPKLMLAGAWQVRENLAALARRVLKTCRPAKPEDGPTVETLLIEDANRGGDVRDEIWRLMGHKRGLRIELIPPVSDKVARLNATVPVFENGVVYAPVQYEWADEVIRAVTKFPSGAHDDYVDTVSGALLYLRKVGVAVRREEWDEMELERRRYRKAAAPVYDV